MLAQLDSMGIIIGAGSWVGVGTLIFCMIRYFPSQRFCDAQHENNKNERIEIRKWIEENEQRAKDRHKEYREDMKELKDLIRNDGNQSLRVQT